jgi:hypothetical protein
MSAGKRAWYVGLALLGVAVLVLKPLYRGPLDVVVYAYGGNFAVSFALYFVASIGLSQRGYGRLAAAISTLVVVEAFEATNGFGVMANVYDPLDFVANAAGVACAVAVDALLEWSQEVRNESQNG